MGREKDGKPKLKDALSAAIALDNAGKWEAADEAFLALLTDVPDHAATHFAHGNALQSRDPVKATEHLRRAIELEPGNTKWRIAFSNWLSEQNRVDEALEVIAKVLEAEPDNMSALFAVADLEERRGNFNAALAHYRRATEAHPDQAKTFQSLAGFLERQVLDCLRRASELEPQSVRAAEALASTLVSRGRMAEGAEAFKRVLEIDPQSARAQRELTLLRHYGGADTAGLRRPAIWPGKNRLFHDLESVVRRYVLTEVKRHAGILSRTTKVATMGSCFAEHVAARLEMRGFDVFYRKIGEDINNTFSNRALMDWIVDGAQGERTVPFDAFFGPAERDAFRKHLRACDVFIFSLGVAPAYFDRETGEFALSVGTAADNASLSQRCRFRTTSLQENADNLRHIIERLRSINPDVEIILTVSPVALMGTYERRSAVLADCVSKSTMRLTVEEMFAAGIERLHYWPSFEVVRWLGTHLPNTYPQVFGEDDGDTRHVSLWLQDLIIKLFMEYFGDESLIEDWETTAQTTAIASQRRDFIGSADGPNNAVEGEVAAAGHQH